MLIKKRVGFIGGEEGIRTLDTVFDPPGARTQDLLIKSQ